MSCLALYVQTIMRILKSFLSKEMRHNRFTKEISGENQCEVFPAELSSSQLREVRRELKVQELEPEDLTFKFDAAILSHVEMMGD